MYSGIVEDAYDQAVQGCGGPHTQGRGEDRARAVTDLVPGVPRVDLVPAVRRYFELVQRTVDINRHLAVRWAETVGTLSGVIREKAESTGDLVREKAEAADNIMRARAEKAPQAALEQAEKAEQAAREQAKQAGHAALEQAEQAARELAARELAAREQAEKAAREQAEKAEKELARQARQAEREQAGRAHKRARERYEGLPKAELSDQLAKRELPKTGNVDQLIERLVEADSK